MYLTGDWVTIIYDNCLTHDQINPKSFYSFEGTRSGFRFFWIEISDFVEAEKVV